MKVMKGLGGPKCMGQNNITSKNEGFQVFFGFPCKV